MKKWRLMGRTRGQVCFTHLCANRQWIFINFSIYLYDQIPTWRKLLYLNTYKATLFLFYFIHFERQPIVITLRGIWEWEWVNKAFYLDQLIGLNPQKGSLVWVRWSVTQSKEDITTSNFNSNHYCLLYSV